MTQLVGNDYDVIISYFKENPISSSSAFKDPYLIEAEFVDYSIKDNLFNYRQLFFSDDNRLNFACFRLRKKPISSLIADLVYIDTNSYQNLVDKMKIVFDEIKENYNDLNKINISLLEKDRANNLGLEDFLSLSGFYLEATFYDEFGLGNHVLVYSKYL